VFLLDSVGGHAKLPGERHRLDARHVFVHTLRKKILAK